MGRRRGEESEGQPHVRAIMARVIRLRNVPDKLHRRLKAQAAAAGLSLSEYVLAKVQQLAQQPTIVELRERLRRRAVVATPISAAKAVRRERDSR